MSLMKFESCTTNEFKNIFFKWTVEDYSLLKMHNSHINLVSQEFSDFRKDFGEQKGIVKMNVENSSNVRIHNLNTYSTHQDFNLEAWNNIFDKSKGLLPGDKLTINCKMEFLKKTVHKPRYFTKVSCRNMLEDFGVLFDTKEFSDVTIVTGDAHNILAHKIILSARCKVFAAMFKHPLKESKENCVAISDFNSDVVNEMLRFIYTGEVPNLKDMTADLMAAAEKYQLDELKAMCAQSMSDNLSVETAPIVLMSALIYNIKDLKTEAIRYIENNLEKVTETSNWKKLTKTNKNLISEVFLNSRLGDLKLNEDTSIKE